MLRWAPLQRMFSSEEDLTDAVLAREPKKYDEHDLPIDLSKAFAATNNAYLDGGRLSPLHLEEVERICRGEGAPDYSRLACAFFSRYFLKNAAKCMGSLLAEPALLPPSKPELRILDLGAGSGASAAGIIAAVQRLGIRSRIAIDLVECNPFQVRICEDIFRRWDGLGQKGVTLTQIPAPAADFLRQHAENRLAFPGLEAAGYDLIVSSYLLTELSAQAATDVYRELLGLCYGSRDVRPSLLFLGSYLDDCHFGYLSVASTSPDYPQAVLETLLRAIGFNAPAR